MEPIQNLDDAFGFWSQSKSYQNALAQVSAIWRPGVRDIHEFSRYFSEFTRGGGDLPDAKVSQTIS